MKRYDSEPGSPDQLVRYSPKWQYARLMNFPYRGATFAPRMNTIVVSIQGGARPNDRNAEDAAAAYAVSFGHPICARNSWGLLAETEAQTAHRAVLEALSVAFRILEYMHWCGEFQGKWKEIIIKTNNEVLIKSMNEWAWDWMRTGGVKASGENVEYWHVLEWLHRTICKFEVFYHASVRFWKVDRDDLTDADDMMRYQLQKYELQG